MSDPGFEIVNPQELREEVLLQLLAVFVHRFGGEVLISAHEFGMVEGVGVLAKQCNEDYLRLRLDETEIILEMEESEPES
jgi:hypothetical protein